MPIQGLNILIVDDSEDDRVLFAEYLSRHGFGISIAKDGQEALVKVPEVKPHLILMDLWLPMMTGWDVMKRLKANPATRQIPILVVSGHTWVRPVECDGMLFKPCVLDQLGAEIAKILKSRGWETELSPHADPQGRAPTDAAGNIPE